MNSLEALATAAREGAGVVRVPSWQVEADLAAGRPGAAALVRLPADYPPAPVPLHLMFQPSRPASLTIWAFADYVVEHWRGVDPPECAGRADR